MAYKTSFSRGFKSSLLNPYAVEMFVSILLSIFFLIGSYSKNNIFINIKYYIISFSKPGLILVSKPFEIVSNTFHYFENLQETKELNNLLKEENKMLKKEINEKNFYLLENYRLKKLLQIDEKGYSQKITGRVLIDPYKNNEFIFFIDLGKLHGLKLNDIVFNENGMIGRVSELGELSSKIMTIYDLDSTIPVFSIESKKSFFVKGQEEKLSLKHIEDSFDLNHNEIIVTTNAAGYFKEGIRVGRVKKTLNEVYVEPFAKVSDSIYVNVLVYDFERQLDW
ncbi:MAG: hypothetical protein CMM95_01245 [Rickettsiales bacterium]|nr:hypothetical protein [Rickettsiales bacterium]